MIHELIQFYVLNSDRTAKVNVAAPMFITFHINALEHTLHVEACNVSMNVDDFLKRPSVLTSCSENSMVWQSDGIMKIYMMHLHSFSPLLQFFYSMPSPKDLRACLRGIYKNEPIISRNDRDGGILGHIRKCLMIDIATSHGP